MFNESLYLYIALAKARLFAEGPVKTPSTQADESTKSPLQLSSAPA